MNYVRAKVSGNKTRFIDDKYNLDLTYITPRIIAMAFPASGIKQIYRNRLEDVSAFLNEKHHLNYMILNLSEKDYDTSKFQGEVFHFNNWPDHHSPSIELLFTIIHKMHTYLSQNFTNSVVVHCNAGKGRTGTLICSYLLYCGRFDTPQDAFDYYSLKRFSSGEGVTNPSQKRYVEYFYKAIVSKRMPIPKVREIIKIESNCCPYMDYETVSPFCVIHNYENKIIYNNEDNCSTVKVNDITSKDGRGIVFTKDDFALEICGDVMVSLFHYRMVTSSKMFGRVSFNTAFVDAECNEIVFKKKDIDPYKFTQSEDVNDSYEIKITFNKICDKENNVNDVNSLCDKCQNKSVNEIKSYTHIQEIITMYKHDKEIGTQLLFGMNKDDVDDVLKNRDKINKGENDNNNNNNPVNTNEQYNDNNNIQKDKNEDDETEDGQCCTF